MKSIFLLALASFSLVSIYYLSILTFADRERAKFVSNEIKSFVRDFINALLHK
jgi:hypothetical protein